MRRVQVRALVGILVVLMAPACGGGSAGSGSGSQEFRTPAAQSQEPALLVERFLRAANGNDLETMTRLFGTPEQTIVEREGQMRAERRMYVLASILRHRDYAVVGKQTVPGRMLDAIELQVRIETEDETATVPFLVVRSNDGGWIIEQIGIEPLTSGG